MARSRPPSFDFYPEDFLAGTMHLHPVCIGIYIRLLCFQWSHGTIPTDRRQLMQVTGAMPEELDEHLTQVLSKFELCDDGSRRNARLERERARKMLVSEQRANAAQASWAMRRTTNQANPADAIASSKAIGDAPANEDANNKAKGMLPNRKLEDGSWKMEVGSLEVASVGDRWTIPPELDSLEVRTWLDRFAEMRSRIRKPIRDFANTSLLLNRFDDKEHLIFALETCIANEYQGLKPDYRPDQKVKAKKPSPGVTHDPSKKTDAKHGEM
jgi:uncharacterized protein YdaU (DUF1376 family)